MPADESSLEAELSEPTPDTVALLSRLDGDLVILGAGGKMGPSLARLARRSAEWAGRNLAITAVARFSTPGLRESLERDGIHTHSADLLDRSQVAALPDAKLVIFMVGQKFGTSMDPARTWAVNTLTPALAAERYRTARIVAFSTGNVYPLWPADGSGPTETDPVEPVGEYAQSALARERILEYCCEQFGTRMAILRLNYAVEARYGVLRDLADKVLSGEPIDLATGYVNLIWQRDANAAALRALEHCAAPPLVLNLTGPKASVRAIAEAFGRRWGRAPVFGGRESATALLSNPARADRLFGAPAVGLDTMIERVATWVEQGGRSLGKPTHFQERAGRF